MQPQENFTVKAANLAKSSPHAWREFLQAFGELTEVHKENLIRSPLNELPVNQGRAQILSSVLKTLAMCVDEADKIARKANTK